MDHAHRNVDVSSFAKFTAMAWYALACCASFSTTATHASDSSRVRDLESVSEMVSFMSPANFADTFEDTRSEFVGVGIQFYRFRSEYVTIARVFHGSPAALAGVLAGDRITSVGGLPMRYVNPNEVVRRMSGSVGEMVTLTVERSMPGLPKGIEQHFTIERRVVHLPSLDEARMLPNRIAYIRMGALLYNSPKEVREHLAGFLEAGAQGIVLDARWLGGGYVRAAQSIASLVLPKGSAMGIIEGDRAGAIAIQTNQNPIVPPGFPVALLANDSTAGAAELLAAAFRASESAILIGQTTAGRADIDRGTSLLGLVETRRVIETLSSPDGTTIHARGIEAELVAEMTATEVKTLRMQLFESYMGDPEMENEQNHGLVSGNDPDDVTIEDRPLAAAVKWIAKQQP